ncbi:hypothetical protein [Capnocytophaga canis]|uniref:Uncharacterized protein n=1 Tax=Capnocytophaga canis TaxID=1848903 RepID=A0A0B7HVK8_9FLAO|nr:hypothetical protein [Capnocytophaga canis]CEN43400.1 conserved exported hypothetical protein [Capnocytophaga canis]
MNKVMLKKMLFLLLFSPMVFCQTNDYEFIGVVKLHGDEKNIISYRLLFSEEKGKISGFSITDLEGKHETKNKISGFYNQKERKISFSENEILYTKSKIDKYSFCYINFEGNINLKKKNASLKGNFKGLFDDQTKCIDGTIEMVKMEKVEKVVNKIAKKIERSKKIDLETKEKINPVKMLDSLKINKLSKNENLNLFVKNNKIVLDIWDAGKIDNDEIDIIFNGEFVLQNYVVRREKRSLSLNLKEGKNHIKIIAKNEGSMPPNTAKIDISDSDRYFETYTNLKKDEEVSINIIRK